MYLILTSIYLNLNKRQKDQQKQETNDKGFNLTE